MCMNTFREHIKKHVYLTVRKYSCVKDLTIIRPDHHGVQTEEAHNPKDKEGLV